jgi:hypothetical protein
MCESGEGEVSQSVMHTKSALPPARLARLALSSLVTLLSKFLLAAVTRAETFLQHGADVGRRAWNSRADDRSVARQVLVLGR